MLAMPRPSLARCSAAVALKRPAPLRSGWFKFAEIPLPKLGFTRAFAELVALRERLVVTLSEPFVAGIFGRVAPTLMVVVSLRGPCTLVPSSRLVVDAC